MKNKNQVIAIILSSLAFLLIITAIVLSNMNSSSNNLSDLKDNQNEQNSTQEESNQDNGDLEENQKESNEDSSMEKEPNLDNSDTSNNSNSPEVDNSTTPQIPSTENDVIAYFLAEESAISISNQEDITLCEKAKNSFVTIIDFIFYGKEIKGYTFSGLTNSAKLKVIKIALSIDNKIDTYFPNYKDTIKDKYKNFKGKLAVAYLEFTASLCESVGENTCNQAKEDFNTMKESFGFTWDLIKELASSASSKVKEFYESWRGSE